MPPDKRNGPHPQHGPPPAAANDYRHRSARGVAVLDVASQAWLRLRPGRRLPAGCATARPLRGRREVTREQRLRAALGGTGMEDQAASLATLPAAQVNLICSALKASGPGRPGPRQGPAQAAGSRPAQAWSHRGRPAGRRRQQAGAGPGPPGRVEPGHPGPAQGALRRRPLGAGPGSGSPARRGLLRQPNRECPWRDPLRGRAALRA